MFGSASVLEQEGHDDDDDDAYVELWERRHCQVVPGRPRMPETGSITMRLMWVSITLNQYQRGRRWGGYTLATTAPAARRTGSSTSPVSSPPAAWPSDQWLTQIHAAAKQELHNHGARAANATRSATWSCCGPSSATRRRRPCARRRALCWLLALRWSCQGLRERLSQLERQVLYHSGLARDRRCQNGMEL